MWITHESSQIRFFSNKYLVWVWAYPHKWANRKMILIESIRILEIAIDVIDRNVSNSIDLEIDEMIDGKNGMCWIRVLWVKRLSISSWNSIYRDEISI